MKRKRIAAVHYPFIPHYRVPIFNALGESKFIDFQFWSSLSGGQNLNCDSGTWNFKHFQTKYIRFGRYEIEFGVLLKLLKVRPDYYIVLANPNILTSWLYTAIAKILGVRVIFWTHGPRGGESLLKKIILKLYYNLAHEFWLYGNCARSRMIDLGMLESRIHVVFNSLNYNAQKRVRDSFGELSKKLDASSFNPEYRYLISIGRLLPKLKLDEALMQIKNFNISQTEKKYGLIIVGDGPELKKLQSLCQSLELMEIVFFAGAIYEEEELGELYSIANASLVYGRVGLSAMHSLAYGVPVITHDVLELHCPEIEAIVNSVTGEFFGGRTNRSFHDVLRDLKPKQFYYDRCIETIEASYTPQKQLNTIINALNNHEAS